MADRRSALEYGLSEPYKEYWVELGKFIHTFSNAEGTLMEMIRHLSKLRPEVAGAVFGSVRFDAAKDMLTRVLIASGKQDVRERLKPSMAQFAAINTMRNHIVHWGAVAQTTDVLLVSNRRLSPPPDKLNEFVVSAELLGAMRQDLDRINVHLIIEKRPVRGQQRLYDEYLSRPWLYKPPPPFVRTQETSLEP